jgi:hypothetical protein
MIIEPQLPKKEIQLPIAKRNGLEILSQSQGFHSGPVQRRSGYRLIAWSVLAATIDLLILIGMTFIFVASAGMLMKINSNFIPKDTFYQLCGLILLTLTVFYMIILRSFLGFTLGDWTCDLRLGSPLQRQSKFYSLKVIARALLIAVTGFFTLPFLSLLTGKDWAGKITGLNLVSPKK